jgi:hypothetical protein
VEPNSELDNYLAQYQSEGLDQGQGDFTLDPLRALEILREQGSVASHAPLFLFRAIYQHTGGARLTWNKTLFGNQLLWPPEFGSLANDPMRIMAVGAFRASSIQLKFELGRVTIRNHESLTTLLYDSFQETFQAASLRLRHYPVDGLFHPPQIQSPWHRRDYPEGVMELRRIGVEPQAVHFVVDGIEFTEPGALPLNVTVFDDELKCDLSLTRIPETDRKRGWTDRAREVLLEELRSVLARDEQIQLDFDHLSNEMIAALGFLPFLVALPQEDPLRQRVLESVLFRDLFGQYWSLESLLKSRREYGAIYTMDAIPRHCPEEPTGERPVLHWRGDTRRFGETVFGETKSGAGYIYSLALGGGIDDASVLEAVEWEGGNLALLPLGPEEQSCEIQLAGTRRGSETIYLEPPAPTRLRLISRGRDELASWDPCPAFLAQVVVLVDMVLPGLNVEAAWIQSLLTWTGVENLEATPNLQNFEFLERVAGDPVSPQFVEDTFGGEVVPVLEERSASLPERLPFPLLLWAHPLLEQIGFSTKEESSAVRKAYWREDGQKRWLSRYEPMEPPEWGATDGLDLLPRGEHFIAVTESQTLAKLIVWREGRPLGQVFLSEDQFPRGCVLIYVDNDFPADQYWSGPDRDAMSGLGPWIEKMKPD